MGIHVTAYRLTTGGEQEEICRYKARTNAALELWEELTRDSSKATVLERTATLVTVRRHPDLLYCFERTKNAQAFAKLLMQVDHFTPTVQTAA